MVEYWIAKEGIIYKGMAYMKIDTITTNKNAYINCVSVVSGEVLSLYNDTKVLPVNAVLTIE